ncbi:MAG: DUF58 domain-containing protein [Candidatus Brocadiia bacterium]
MSPIPIVRGCPGVLALSVRSGRSLFLLVFFTAIFLLVALLLLAMHRRSLKGRGAQGITKQGLIFFILTLALGVVALHTKINFLVLLFGMMLSASLLSIVLSRITMGKLAFERRVPEGVYPGRPFTVRLQASNRKRRFASYGVAVRDVLPGGVVAERPGGVVVHLRAGQTASLPYTATALRRGVYALDRVQVSTRFPFGFFHQRRTRHVPGELVVYPPLGVVSPNLLGRTQSLAQTRRRSQSTRGEEEFRNLREYRLGDNPRWIHWKSSAKFGRPLVKEHEAVVTERAFLLLDTRCARSGEATLERAVSFVATLARDLMLRDFFVSFAAYVPHLVVTSATKGSVGLHVLLEVLARLEPEPRRSLVELVGEPRVRAEERVLTVPVLLHTDSDAAAALELLQRRRPRVVALDASAPSFAKVFELPEQLAPIDA